MSFKTLAAELTGTFQVVSGVVGAALFSFQNFGIPRIAFFERPQSDGYGVGHRPPLGRRRRGNAKAGLRLFFEAPIVGGIAGALLGKWLIED